MHPNRLDAARALLLRRSRDRRQPACRRHASPARPVSRTSTPSVERMTDELVAAHGEAQRARIAAGPRAGREPVARRRTATPPRFEEFARRHFARDDATRKALLERMDRLHEQLDGSLNEIGRDFRWQADVETGPILPFDELFAAYDPAAHVERRLLRQQDRLRRAAQLPADDARARSSRDGAELDAGAVGRGAAGRAVRDAGSRPRSTSRSRRRSPTPSRYIAGYNIWMHHVLDDRRRAAVPAGQAPHHPLEPARRAQGELRGEGRPGASSA